MGQKTKTTFKNTAPAIPDVPLHSDMFDIMGQSVVGNLTRVWFLFFQRVAQISTATAGAFKSPLTTKGDIWGYDTIDDRIPVGTDGQVLTANSHVPLGVSWQTPSGGGGGGGATFVFGEVPGGIKNNVNVTFTLTIAPNPALSLVLMLNGVYQLQGVDYTLSGLTITYTKPPVPNDWHVAALYSH